MDGPIDLLVPLKWLDRAKSRLRDATGGDARSHVRLVLAMALDTLTAARAAERVRRVVVITADPAVAEVVRAEGFDTVRDTPDAGLNAALEHGAGMLRALDPTAGVGALQGDLPALRPDELDDALAAAPVGRSFCPDHQGSGTTLLLAGPGHPLDPRFGPGSARAHAASGATPLLGPWPSLRCDVDLPADLRRAADLGLGAHTRAFLDRAGGVPGEGTPGAGGGRAPGLTSGT